MTYKRRAFFAQARPAGRATGLTAVAGLGLWLCSAAGAGAASAVHDLCYMSWASDPEAQTACVAEQIEGAQIVARYLDWAKRSAGADGQHVIETFEQCQGMWLPDYASMAACLQRRSAIAPPELRPE